MDQLLYRMNTMGFLVAGLSFWRFWRKSADGLFAAFGAAFLLFALDQLFHRDQVRFQQRLAVPLSSGRLWFVDRSRSWEKSQMRPRLRAYFRHIAACILPA